ncbi:hypothetical protein ERJ75_001324000 [Trypanosoma vivax]|uniref:Peptidase S54 rhomboid domain-containing protein n=1 Tax=Trypanosoma vivax (strain Y486) TaxID=1055687 RepID=G0U0Y7_TRYVY|nr:hypothetical protein TRVL_04211 [Trypanosoma vivax]KAH8607799.1 hypothetical protein ERJ75_001324000 [Trypanosoma vivax]CCC49742.1 conserved hypothetical protein [Trypanosoma vivax Y486]
MLRLRCSVPVSSLVSRGKAHRLLRAHVALGPVGVVSFTAPLIAQRRWMRARGTGRASGEDASQDAKCGGNTKTGKSPSGGGLFGRFRDHTLGLGEDIKNFPDIYNSANAFNMILFTAFCLCSTGSNVEEKWWMDNWGIDATFAPQAWILHSFMTNNFLSMALAMLLLHSMCHSVLPTIGSRGLARYCLITAAVSGFLMWAGNYMANKTNEKQFGPWDIVAALFVMQYLQQGFTPMQILNSFSGWVRYACWVGVVCVAYFDWQPTIIGTGVGLALCRAHPKFRVSTTA